MANYATLKASVNSVITTNGNNEITGALLNQLLLSLIDSLGANYQFRGIAFPSTNPGTPDQNVAYIAGSGTYPNFAAAVVPYGSLAVMKYNGAWTVETVAVGKDYDEQIEILESIASIFSLYYINLFDKDTVTTGKAVSRNVGILFDMERASASDFIEIPEGVTSLYITKPYAYGSAGWAIYDANKTFVRGNTTNPISIASGEKYLRITVLNTDVDTAMVTRGTATDAPAEYVPHNLVVEFQESVINGGALKDGAVTTPKLADGAVTTLKLADGAVTKDKAGFIEKIKHASGNLLNPNEVEDGYILASTGEHITTITTRKVTGYIPVESDIYTNCATGYGGRAGWAVYDANKRYLRGGLDSPNGAYVYQEGDAFIRITIITTGLEVTSYVVKATDAHRYTPYYEPYYTYRLAADIGLNPDTRVPSYEPALSLAGLSGSKGSGTTLSNGKIEITDFPHLLKWNFNVTLGGKISTFETVELGIGRDTGNGVFARIDGTNIYTCRYSQGNPIVVETFAHGLTISDFIRISAIMKDGIITVRIATFAGATEHTFNRMGVGVDFFGYPFAWASSGTSLTGVTIRTAGVKFRCPVWVIGDSFVSLYEARWPYQLIHEYNFSDFLLDGLAGGRSAALLEELKTLLNYGTPKFLLWCLGMNDTYAQWNDAFKELKEICADKGITLILQTIPWPQSGPKAEINTAIKNSGYRYVDGYAAVCSDDNGTWYDGYTTDGVHPTVVGAKAMAAQFLVDFPEFLQ